MTRRIPAQYDFRKLDFDETILGVSPITGRRHFSPLASRDIDYVVVHHMTIVGKDDSTSALTACYNVWQSRQASAHYGVQGGFIRQFVWDKDFAWATGSNAGNLHGISIEHANTKAGPTWTVSELTWKTGARLAAAIHVKYKLGRPVKDVTIRKHSVFTSTACPGPFLGGSTTWNAYVKEAQRVYDVLIKGGDVTPPIVPPVVTKPKTHKVVGWDTLWAISKKYGVTVEQIASWNGLKQPYILKIGLTLRLTAPGTPKPPPPAPKNLQVEYISANLAGYDARRGEANRVRRAKQDIPNYLLPKQPDWFHFQECAIDMFPELDKKLKGYKRVAQGGKGRESYYRTDLGIKILKAELRNVKTMLEKDTKEFLLIAWEQDGYRGVYANFHNENEGTSVQLKQLREVMTAAKDFADDLGIPRRNIAITGDGNKKEAAAYVKEQAWAEASQIADRKIDLQYHSTNAWRHSLTVGRRIDIDVFQADADVLEAEQLFGALIADHWPHRVIHGLVK